MNQSNEATAVATNEDQSTQTSDVKGQVHADVNDFINSMSTPVEETDFDISSVIGEETTEEPDQGQSEGQQATSEDDFYDYGREDEEAAHLLWELIDRGQAFACAILANEPMSRFQKITESNPPSKRAIKVTASLLKKYSLNFTLEHQLILLLVAAFGPNVFTAAEIRSKKAKQKSKEKDGQKP